MRRVLIVLFLLLSPLPVAAQDGLNLPTELYVLLNAGAVERYGLGVAGVQQVTPADSFVIDFRVAPDGNWIAYRTQEGLFMANMFVDGTTRQLEGASASIPPLRGRGETIAWSPNSDALAYTTETGARVHILSSGAFYDITAANLLHLVWSPQGNYLAAEATENVWWVYQRGDAGVVGVAAIPAAYGAAWLTNTQMVFAPTDGGLIVMDLAQGNQQIPVITDTQIYRLPYVLHDGRIRVFTGSAEAASLVDVSVNAGEVSTQDMASGTVNLSNVRWAPQGNLLIAFQGGAVALVDPFSGSGFTLPITTSAAYSWGPTYPPSGVGVALSNEGLFIARDENGLQQVWLLPADGSIARPITTADNDIMEYALAFDNNQLAYISSGQLWVKNLSNDEDARTIVDVPLQRTYPAWSPNGQFIYITGEGGTIQRVSVADGSVEDYLSPDSDGYVYTRVYPARGLDALAITIHYADERRGFALVDANTRAELARYITRAGSMPDDIAADPVQRANYFMYSDPYWLENTEILFAGTIITANGVETAPAERLPGLYRVDINQVTAAPVAILPLFDGVQIMDFRPINSETVRLLLLRHTLGELLIVDVPRAGGLPVVVGNAGYMVNPQLAPDGNTIIGMTAPDGAFIMVDVTTDNRYLLDSLPQGYAFQWR